MLYCNRQCGVDKLKIFISWSGTTSQEVAKVLKQWIPCVIQSVEPYFSSGDIDKGARWSTDIAKELQDATFGILCVTQENLNSAWLNFEAGALSKSIDQSKVCPFLVDLKPSDIQNSPILQFQMASATKEDVLKLFESINANLDDCKLTEDILSTTFETFWPKIESALSDINSKKPADSSMTVNRDEQKPIEEILELVRYQYKLLKSPQDLLPPEYLLKILRNPDHGLSREYIMELNDLARRINVTATHIGNACPIMDGSNSDMPLCNNMVNEIVEMSDRMMMLLRRAGRAY